LDDITAYLVNSFQELEFRIEDWIMHSVHGSFVVLALRIKQIIKRLRGYYSIIKIRFYKKPHLFRL